MKLAVFLAIGETWEGMEKTGQSELLVKNNFFYYSKHFSKTYVFSYGRLSKVVLPNVYIVGNPLRLHRFIYAFLLPLIHRHIIKSVSIVRGMQITGGIPALVAKYFLGKPVVVNFGYDYVKVAQIESKYLQSMLYRVVNPVILSLADAVIVTTKFLFNEVNNKTTYSVLIPNGIDVTKFRPSGKGKSTQLLFVGRLARQKKPIVFD